MSKDKFLSQKPQITRPVTRLDNAPSPDEGRRILSELPDCRYNPGDLGRTKTEYYLAAAAIINEWIKHGQEPPKQRGVPCRQRADAHLTAPATEVRAVHHSESGDRGGEWCRHG